MASKSSERHLAFAVAVAVAWSVTLGAGVPGAHSTLAAMEPPPDMERPDLLAGELHSYSPDAEGHHSSPAGYEFENNTCTCQGGTATCSKGYGVLNSTGGTCSFEGASDGSAMLVMVWAVASEMPDLNEDCDLTVGDTTFSNDSLIRNTTTMYIFSDETITVNGGSSCRVVLHYAAVEPTTNCMVINDTDGDIVFPTSEDQMMEPWGYPPQQRLAYTFEYPDNYIIELSVTRLDLGYRSAHLNWHVNYNCSYNDFLLVGVGSMSDWSNASHYAALYGSVPSPPPMRLNSGQAYVEFYSTYHEQYATGFSLHYSAREEPELPTTTVPPPPSSLPPRPSAWAPIDGVLYDNSSLEAINSSFCDSVSEMATLYINATGLEVDPPSSVSPSDVLVHEVATCSPATCDDGCAAFNFSINKTNGGAWAFTQHDLEVMLRDTELQDVWEEMCEDCAFCEEHPEVPWWELWGLLLLLGTLTVVLGVLGCRIYRYTTHVKSQDDYNTIRTLERVDRRRRSSGEVSVIGGYKAHRRSLPFRRASSDDDIPRFSVEKIDVSGFSMFEPDDDLEEYSRGAGEWPGGPHHNAGYSPTEDEFWTLERNRARGPREGTQDPPVPFLAYEGPPAGGVEGDGRGQDPRASRWRPQPVAVLVHDPYSEETEL